MRNKDAVNTEAVKQLPGCLGVQWSGDQLQVIIGQSVGDAYQLVLKKHDLGNLGQNRTAAASAAPAQKKNKVIAVLDLVAGGIAPIVPALIAV